MTIINTNKSLILVLFSVILSFKLEICLSKLINDSRPNVLFIMSEDLRPELPSYGRKISVAPNIQRIADKGLIFDLATCQVAICAPSRSSMLTGLLPDRLGSFFFCIIRI